MNYPLIVFDSGIGGFSILKYLLKYSVPIIYFADSKYFPYGEKSPTLINKRLSELALIFAKYNPLGVVIACNTGTTTAINNLRDVLSCPVIGVEPVVKPIRVYRTPVIWGTTVTINSSRANFLRAEYGAHIRYYTPHNLASAIEYHNQSQIADILSLAKKDLGSPDAIGLSCTHYPLIINQIEKVFPKTVVIDPSQAVAAQVQKVLKLKLHNGNEKTKVQLMTTGNLLKLERAFAKYVGHT